MANMNLTWDETKRQTTLAERAIDFAQAGEVFSGPTAEFEDIRKNYGEQRMICFGWLAGRLMAVGYVQRGQSRHIFSMRKANDREITRYAQQLA